MNLIEQTIQYALRGDTFFDTVKYADLMNKESQLRFKFEVDKTFLNTFVCAN